MPEIREIHEDELARWVAVTKAATNEARHRSRAISTGSGRPARQVWLLASEGKDDVGAAIGIGGWHSPDGRRARRGHRAARVPRSGDRVGAPRVARRPGRATSATSTSMGPVKETDDVSLAWAARRGFVEIGRNSTAGARSDASREARRSTRRTGSRSSRGRSGPASRRGCTRSRGEAYPDVPGEEDAEVASYEEWLAKDMQGAGDRPEATFVALSDGEVVAYAKLSLSRARPTVAMHDMTGVRRALAWSRDRPRAQGRRDRLGAGERL